MKQLVQIKWKDAVVRPTVSATAEEAGVKASFVIVTQVGYLLYEDNEKLVLGWQHYSLGDKYKHLLSIPKEMIIETKKLPSPD